MSGKVVFIADGTPMAAFWRRQLELACALECLPATGVDEVGRLLSEHDPRLIVFLGSALAADDFRRLSEELSRGDENPPLLGIFEPDHPESGTTENGIFELLPPENRLRLPQDGEELAVRVRALLGDPDIADSQPMTADDVEEEEIMQDTETAGQEVIELTDIVEEGLPLDQLPDLPGVKTGGAAVLPEAAVLPGEDEVSGLDDFAAEDEFGATLSDLESDFEKSEDAFDKAESDDDFMAESLVDLAETPPLEAEPEQEEMAPESGAEIEEDEPISGDVDALLDDDEFAEIELTETPDPVLDELKSAGLRPENEVGIEPELPETGAEESGDGAFDPSGELPEDYLVEEDLPDVENTDEAVSEDPVVLREEEVGTTEKDAPDPVENTVEDEVGSALASTIRRQVEAAAPSAEPEVCAEPLSTPDFSRQIENLTQEWSKQLLQSTYASMDKMIQAIGDLAPTIVDRVAREIIPPLAEQVIKAEIARLEKKLEAEDEAAEEEDDGPPALEREN
ncbi:MAG: hypothetical protein GXO34_08305 [Deltaproteobacteria bacterium]|nr:hypothetical protein [Deltaproteobacteria bacterium]